MAVLGRTALFVTTNPAEAAEGAETKSATETRRHREFPVTLSLSVRPAADYVGRAPNRHES